MRSVLVVLAGLIAWAVFATLFNLVLRFGLEGYELAEHAYNFTLAMLVGRLGVGAFASVGAGIACSWVSGVAASHRRRKALAAVTGALLVLGFIPVHYYMWQAFPVWYHAFFLLTLLPFVMLGERLARPAPKGA
jgi:hypothetical protein